MNALVRARNFLGLTQREMARALGLSPRTLQRREALAEREIPKMERARAREIVHDAVDSWVIEWKEPKTPELRGKARDFEGFLEMEEGA